MERSLTRCNQNGLARLDDVGFCKKLLDLIHRGFHGPTKLRHLVLNVR